MNPIRLALVGTGGVGKSTLLKLFEECGYLTFPSITREYYELKGIATEDGTLSKMSADERSLFQTSMRTYYKKRYWDFVTRNRTRNLVTDRSIFDHLAYGIYGTEGVHTPKDIQTLIDDAVSFANGAYTNLIGIPYPQPWMTPTSAEDGFRSTDASKNYSLSSMIIHTIQHESSFNRLVPQFSVLDRSLCSPRDLFLLIQDKLKPIGE